MLFVVCCLGLGFGFALFLGFGFGLMGRLNWLLVLVVGDVGVGVGPS